MPDKKEAIMEAMLDLVVEHGFHHAPMSTLAKRAGVSAGSIYTYFPGKEALITALYERIRSMKQTALLAGLTAEMPAREAFIHVWVNAYRFYNDHLRETRFLDQYECAPFACAAGSEADSDPVQSAFQRRFSGRKQGGVVNDLPPEVIQELTFGLASRLAKQPGALSRATLEDVAGRVWTAISE
jgi:AcrR family transcriptional regulator